MMFTLLTVAAVGVTITAAYVYATKSEPVEALAGETTLANSADPAAETIASGRHLAAAPVPDWHLTTVSALHDAEELLDVLEYQGYAERELVVLGNSCFAVRWR